MTAARAAARPAGRAADAVDFVAAALADPPVRDSLRRLGLDTAALGQALATERRQHEGFWRRLFERRAPSLDSVLEPTKQFARLRGLETIDALHLFEVLLLRRDGWSALLNGHGIALLAVRRFIAHGLAGDAPEWRPAANPPAGECTVVLHNDAFTSMDFVVALLEEVFALPPEDAIQLMMDVHHADKHPIGVFPAALAHARAADALARAAAADFPLLVSVRR